MASCYAPEFPTFQRAMRIIASITNSNPAIVTTTFHHDYSTGLIVRLNIPLGFGMQQANQASAAIVVTGETTFTMDLDTSAFDAFMVPSPSYQCANVTPIGEINEILTQATQNVLPY